MPENNCSRCHSPLSLTGYVIVDDVPDQAKRIYVVELYCQACGMKNERIIKKGDTNERSILTRD